MRINIPSLTKEHFLTRCYTRWNIMALTSSSSGEPDLPVVPDIFDHPEDVDQRPAHVSGGLSQRFCLFDFAQSPNFSLPL